MLYRIQIQHNTLQKTGCLAISAVTNVFIHMRDRLQLDVT